MKSTESYKMSMMITRSTRLDDFLFVDIDSEAYKEAIKIPKWYEDDKLWTFVKNNDIENVILYKEILNETKPK